MRFPADEDETREDPLREDLARAGVGRGALDPIAALRGSAKGERLLERLLQQRQEHR